jgi:hypothetical protein
MFFSIPDLANEPFISEIRLKFHNSTSNEKTCKDLIAQLSPYNEKSNALLFGYRGGATMIMAKYVFNPFSKLSYFNKGRDMIEKAIQHDKNNVELRFLRYTIQTNVPSFLGYNDHKKSDRLFLSKSVSFIKDSSLKKIIISYLNQSKTA